MICYYLNRLIKKELFSKWVTQGDPLAMVAYGLGPPPPPFIREFWTSHPSITLTWYADEAGSGGTFEGICCHLDNLRVRRPLGGYSLEPTKSVLVVSPQKVPQVEAFFRGYGLQIVKGSRYLGGLVETDSEQAQWLGEKIAGWRDLVATLEGVAHWHLQTAYVGLQKSLQQEWAFVQHITPGIGMEFQAVEDEL